MPKKSELSRSMRPLFHGAVKIEIEVYRKECHSPSKKSQQAIKSGVLLPRRTLARIDNELEKASRFVCDQMPHEPMRRYHDFFGARHCRAC